MLCCVRVNWSWKSPLLVWWMTLVTLISKCYIEIILVWSSAQEYREFLCDPSSGWCSLGPNTLKSATYCYISHGPLSCPRLPMQDTRVTTLSVPHNDVVQSTCEGILCVLDRASSWYLNKSRPTRWHSLYYPLLNMFQTIRPSSGACDCLLRCVGWLEVCWCYVAGLSVGDVVSECRLNHYSQSYTYIMCRVWFWVSVFLQACGVL